MGSANLLDSGDTADNLNQKVTARDVGDGRCSCQGNTYTEPLEWPAAVQDPMKMVGKSGLTVAFEAGRDCYPAGSCNFQMPHTLINHYRAVESTSAQMLACAAVADWRRVLDCEQRCSELIQQLGDAQQLGRAAGRSGLTPEQRLEKGEIMKRILEIDAQIRSLAEPSTARYAHLYRHSVSRVATP